MPFIFPAEATDLNDPELVACLEVDKATHNPRVVLMDKQGKPSFHGMPSVIFQV